MATPVVRSVSNTQSTGFLNSTVTVSIPAGAVEIGDLLIVSVSVDSGNAANWGDLSGAGWTRFRTVDRGTNAPKLRIWWKINNSTAAQSYSVTLSGANWAQVGYWQAWQAGTFNQLTPLSNAASHTGAKASPYPTTETTLAADNGDGNRVIQSLWSLYNGGTPAVPAWGTRPTGWSQLANRESTGDYNSQYGAYRTLVPSSTSTTFAPVNFTVADSASRPYVNATYYINPSQENAAVWYAHSGAVPAPDATYDFRSDLGEEFAVTTSGLEFRGFYYYRFHSNMQGINAALFDCSTGVEVPNSRVTFGSVPAVGTWRYESLDSPVALVANKRYRASFLLSGSGTVHDYYKSGPGGEGLNNGPLYTPSEANATGAKQNAYQSVNNTTGVLVYPNTTANLGEWFGLDYMVGTRTVDLRAGTGYAGPVRLSDRSSGLRRSVGTGHARHGFAARAAGSKATQGNGDAATRLYGPGRGAKVGRGVHAARTTTVGENGSGVKRGIGRGWWQGLAVGGYAIAPPPVPIFNGRPLPEDPLPMTQSRYLVQNILTGQWLHSDLPLSDDTVKLTLSGPCEIAGRIDPEYADLKTPAGTPLLRSWGHVVYLEMDGEIRAAGLITEDSYDDQTQSIVCQGVSAYPDLTPYMGKYRRYLADPLQIAADMWTYVQSFANANLSVAVTRTAGVPASLYGAKVNPVPGDKLAGLLYGARPEGTNSESDQDPPVIPIGQKNTLVAVYSRLIGMGYRARVLADPAKPAGPGNSVPAGTLFVRKADIEKAYNDYFLTPGQPYGLTLANPPDVTSSVVLEPYKLDWWDVKSCGDVINEAAKSLPVDYVEQYSWNYPHTFVDQKVFFSYPRAGRRRDDLRFVQGENIVEPVAVDSDPDGFATCVIGIGAGEGSSALRETAETILPGRTRKTYVYQNKKITDRNVLRRIVTTELAQRSTGGYSIKSIVVKASHVNAQFGAYSVGDDIFVQAEVAQYGLIRLWCRIVSMTLSRGTDLVQIAVERSDSFYYGREVESTS